MLSRGSPPRFQAIHRPAKLKRHDHLKRSSVRRTLGSRNIETAVSFRRVVDPGRAPVALHGRRSIDACWLLRRVLSPMRDGSLVAPFEQTPHDRAMRAGHHESLHCRLIDPKRAGPEGIARLAQDADTEVAPGVSRLQRRPECREEKRREILPRPHAQTRYRHKRHVLLRNGRGRNIASPVKARLYRIEQVWTASQL